jgi:hypothetical protein
MYNSEILVWNDCLLVILEWLQEVYLSSSPVLILKHEIKNAKNYSMKLKIIARNFYANVCVGYLRILKQTARATKFWYKTPAHTLVLLPYTILHAT